ncbi:MAG: PAS domain-containing hybrid sensor histidine kinase/response regulator [Planctomycetota bacterium]|nr:MAG: PAS domain-containing hybrid sensor histidine kinase/response regulator [Planctomycetota bacterium]
MCYKEGVATPAPSGADGPAGRGRVAPDLYRELFERSPDAILIIDGDRFVDCNEAAARTLGFPSREELVRRFHASGEERLLAHPAEFSPPRQPDGRDSWEKAEEMIRIAFARGSHRFEWDHLRADGEIFPVEVLLIAFETEGRRLLHVTWREIGKRRELEARLRQAQRLEAIGKLAGGVAHDFNNLLLVIQGYTAMLSDRLGDREDARSMLAEIEKASARATELTREMLAFSRLQVLRPRIFDLGRLVATAARQFQPLTGDGVELVVETPAEPVAVEADPTQFERVLHNLVRNAVDAMPDGGRITLRVDQAGGEARLRVADTGEGMAPDLIERIFEPFFTTKPAGRGTGLGLAVVHGIVSQSGGRIEVASTPGAGTEFTIRLPASDQPIPASPSAAGDPVPTAPRRARILLAEDEEGIRALLVQVLEQAGFRVEATADGQEALEALRAGGGYDLLLSDVVLPRLGGIELARLARDEHPATAILLMTGFQRGSPIDLDRLGRQYDLLEKPFAPADLLDRIEAVLAARTDS